MGLVTIIVDVFCNAFVVSSLALYQGLLCKFFTYLNCISTVEKFVKSLYLYAQKSARITRGTVSTIVSEHSFIFGVGCLLGVYSNRPNSVGTTRNLVGSWLLAINWPSFQIDIDLYPIDQAKGDQAKGFKTGVFSYVNLCSQKSKYAVFYRDRQLHA